MTEPLKNKGFDVSDQKGKAYFLYADYDIKSAVEWLKHKCFRELIDGSMETRDNINTLDMHELIDKAFEDIK